MSDSETTAAPDASPQQLSEVTGMQAPNLDKHNSGTPHTHGANPSTAAQHGKPCASGAKLDRPQPTPRRPELPPLARPDERLKRPISREGLPFARRRSGGPQTAEGRARSSLNAIKHGGYVTARSAALDFHETFSELISRVNPSGTIEEGVVNSLACELFRLSMLSKLELERVQTAVNAEVSPQELGRALDYPWLTTHPDELRNPPALEVLHSRLHEFFASQLEALRESQRPGSRSELNRRTVDALEQAIADLQDAINRPAKPDEHVDDDAPPQPSYFDELDRHMRILACGNKLLSHGVAPPTDPQPLVDYWLFRNRHQIEATRRDLQVKLMIRVLTDERVRRARGHATRQLDDCVRLLELLRGGPVDFGSAWHSRLEV